MLNKQANPVLDYLKGVGSDISSYAKGTLDNMYTPTEQNNLRNLALVSLAAGVGFPVFKHIFSSPVEKPYMLPSSGSGMTVNLPVPEDEMSAALPEFTGKRKAVIGGKTKELRKGDVTKKKPVEKISEAKKQAEFYSGFTNPYYAPGFIAALAAPGLAGYHLANKLLSKKKNLETEAEEEDAKNEFAKALIEAHANKLNRPVKAAAANQDKITEFSNDLEKLACLYEKQAQEGLVRGSNINPRNANPDVFNQVAKAAQTAKNSGPGDGAWFNFNFPNPFEGLGDYALEALSGVREGLGNLGSVAKGALGSYGGLLAASGLLGLGAGTYYGHRAAQRADKDTEDAYKYMAQFLERQQQQGSPIYLNPIPVAKKKKPWYSFS